MTLFLKSVAEAQLFPGMLRMSLYGLFPVQRSVLKAAGTGESVWLQESAAVRRDGWVVPATPVSKDQAQVCISALYKHRFFCVSRPSFTAPSKLCFVFVVCPWISL